MSDLSLGLAFGLAAAGAIGGAVFNAYASLANMMNGGVKQSRTSFAPHKNVRAAIALGAFLGAAAGTGIGMGIDALREPKAPAPVTQTTPAVQPK